MDLSSHEGVTLMMGVCETSVVAGNETEDVVVAWPCRRLSLSWRGYCGGVVVTVGTLIGVLITRTWKTTGVGDRR